MQTSSKQSPCEECREHKRRCSGQMPCERCKKANLKCVYSKVISPLDLEYINEMKLRQDIKLLQEQMTLMENDVIQLQLKEPNPASLTRLPAYSSSASSSSEEDTPSPSEDTQVLHGSDKSYKQLAQYKSYTASTHLANAKNAKPSWVLTVAKDNSITIETTVKSHAELLTSLGEMIKALEYDRRIPPLMEKIASQSSIAQAVRFVAWGRYGKSRFRSMDRKLPVPRPQPSGQVGMIDISVIATKLIQAYLQCHQLQFITLHRPTFVTLFLNQPITYSPAAMALAATATCAHCQHIAAVVPASLLTVYGQLFFERGKELLEDRFDEISLEAFVGYVLLGFYRVKRCNEIEGTMYSDMAGRLYHILYPLYSLDENSTRYKESVAADPLYPGKCALFHRISQVLERMRSLLYMIPVMKSNDPNQKHDAYHRSLQLMPGIVRRLYPVEGDSPQEIHYMQTTIHMQTLQKMVQKAMADLNSEHLSEFVELFAHQLECVMTHWYNHTLTPEFKLSLPLFDCSTTDDVYRTVVSLDCFNSLSPVMTTLRVYAEYIIMAKSFLPKSTESFIKRQTNYTNVMSNLKNQPSISKEHEKYIKRTEQVNRLLSMIKFDGSRTEFYQQMKAAMTTKLDDLEKPLLDRSVRASILATRLIQYMNEIPGGPDICLYDHRILNDISDMLSRCEKLIKANDGGAPPRTDISLNEIYAAQSECLRLMQQVPVKFGTSLNIVEMESELQDSIPKHVHT